MLQCGADRLCANVEYCAARHPDSINCRRNSLEAREVIRSHPAFANYRSYTITSWKFTSSR